MTCRSGGARFVAQCDESGSREAFRAPAPDDVWRSMTSADTATWAREPSAGLLALGVQPQQRVAIPAATGLKWTLADPGVTLAGAAITIVYPSTNAEPEDQRAVVARNRAALIDDMYAGATR
jgi:long-chain acyl-CoA synthetase